MPTPLDEDALDHLVRLAGGDARRSLTYLEAAAGAASARDSTTIDLETAETAADQAAVRYDREGDQHYDVTSAFIKSLRGSDVDAALHYLARMIEAGEDPRFIARRLVILASEDIGLADPTALPTAVAAAQAVQLIGMPEARLNLAQATIALAIAPKSNAVITAIEAASADVRAGKIGPVPAHLRDAHYGGAKKLGHGASYTYSHDAPYGIAEQQYAPDVVLDAEYYKPTSLGAEAAIKERWERVRRIIRVRGGSVGSVAMAWVLLTVTGVLAVLVGVLALRVRRLDAQVARLLASSDANVLPNERSDSTFASLDENPPAPGVRHHPRGRSRSPSRCRRCPAPVFADLLLKETVVQTRLAVPRAAPRAVAGDPQPDPVPHAPGGQALPQAAAHRAAGGTPRVGGPAASRDGGR